MKKILIIFAALSLILLSCVSNSQDTENKASETKDSIKTEQSKSTPIACVVKPEDKQKFAEIMNYAKTNNLSSKPIADIEMEVAKQLLEIPYLGHTLEVDGEEQLVINLRELDCTTFLENVVALSLTIKNNGDFNSYCQQLTTIRYRNGKIDKYPSRLHYFTDWLLDNQKKGIIEIVSEKYGDADFDPTVNFMSTHSDKYKKLKGKADFIKQIAEYEKYISNAKLKYFTPEGLQKNTDKIQDGDLIAFATTMDGLDISHVAIARFENGKLHFYHASSAKKKVVLSENTMVDYLKKMKRNNGVLVARIITQ